MKWRVTVTIALLSNTIRPSLTIQFVLVEFTIVLQGSSCSIWGLRDCPSQTEWQCILWFQHWVITSLKACKFHGRQGMVYAHWMPQGMHHISVSRSSLPIQVCYSETATTTEQRITITSYLSRYYSLHASSCKCAYPAMMYVHVREQSCTEEVVPVEWRAP